MAGRPASGGSTGILWGMGVSIGVAVLALVFLVVLWTNQEELRAATERAQQEARRLMTSAEGQSAYRTWMDKATGGRSVVGLMGSELTQFSELVAGDQTPVQPGAVEQLRGGGLEALWQRIGEDESIDDPNQIVDQPLIAALEATYQMYTATHQRYTDAQNEVLNLTGQVESLAEDKRQKEEAFESKAAELASRVEEIAADRDAFREAKDEAFREMEEATLARGEEERRVRQDLEGQLVDERGKLAKAEEAKRQMQEKLREFQILPKQGGSARHADATIILATPGSDAVFVDLGRDDNLILGLRFAVYTSQRHLPSGGRAKAAVEVVDIGDEVTECRVVWLDGSSPIIEGDVVGNPIYDRQRQLVFMVIGEFDLNYDGVDDAQGRETIEAVIKDFNGVISEQLTARVDFLIVGARPLQPRLPRDPEEAAVIKMEYEERLDLYGRVVENARALSVPMLTQETFLNFLGRG